jgi:hypothetical protein
VVPCHPGQDGKRLGKGVFKENNRSPWALYVGNDVQKLQMYLAGDKMRELCNVSWQKK